MGDVMRDIIVRPAGPLRRGADQRAMIRSTFGGSGANQAAWLARFGAPVRFVGCVGEADHAAETSRLRRQGVEPVVVAHPSLPTGTLVAMLDPDGERSFLTDRGANDGLPASALPEAVLDGIGHFHLSAYALTGETTRATALLLLDRARQTRTPISFDAGSTSLLQELGPGRVLDWMAGASLCVANAHEAEIMAGTRDPDRQLASLCQHFDLALIKRGADGATAGVRDGSCWVAPAPVVAVVDTTGAGDAFFAAFLAARLTGESVAACLQRAVAAGAQAVTMIGGWPSI
jgi:sugar/nucleoside kinase (ribokinase family)